MVKLIIFSDGTLLQGDLALPYQLLFEPPSSIYISGQQSNMSRMPTCVISVMTLEQSISEVIIS